MDDWEKFNKTLLPEKKCFYSYLNMEDVTDADYTNAKRVWKRLWNNSLGKYHDLYVQSDNILLADIFENFSNMCHQIYELDSARFLLHQD